MVDPRAGPAGSAGAAGLPNRGGAASVGPIPAPGGLARAASGGATPSTRAVGTQGELVVPPTVHVHGTPRGEVTTGLWAGHINWAELLIASTVRNLGHRMFSGKAE